MENFEQPFDDHDFVSPYNPPEDETATANSRIVAELADWIPDQQLKTFLLDAQRSWLFDYRQSLEKANVELLEKMHAAAERDKDVIRKRETAEFNRKLAALRNQFEVKYEQDFGAGLLKLAEEHEVAERAVKSKQWCTCCLKQAYYYCCWNTQYCSPECQTKHWKEHKSSCRRAATKAA